ncbi:hypothetical protein, partial [Candidatus Pseudothioglobus singularis]|uniref:hypothetical protein n=1 Tax=Candidatus Pseudothioglobus singularis TaxID=1427364 RepID=UPI0018D305CA
HFDQIKANQVNLLTAADAFATTCANAAKIAWTTALSTSYVVTENSTFAMSIVATAANRELK